jgi:16S rRNA (guanine966-N2)-methyltransferase
MKDRIRQAIFNLIGPDAVQEVIVWDLFAGTGLLALEAISRGAASGFAVERTPWLAGQLRKHCESLGIKDRLRVVIGDAFRFVDQMAVADGTPWLVFVCPPYVMFTEQGESLRRLISTVIAKAPPGSTFIVEFDESFAATQLPQAEKWSTRRYRPTVIAWRSKDQDDPSASI